MILLKQPNDWSCGLTSLSMLLGIREEILIKKIGHDGSEIILPELGNRPAAHRGFVLDELQDVCISRGYCLAQINASPTLDSRSVYTEEDADKRLQHQMTNNPGLIEGAYSLDRPHMVAWDGTRVFDPSGPKCYSIEDRSVQRISILCFWRLMKVKV